MTYKNMFISLFITAIIILAAWTTLSYHPRSGQSPSSSLLPDAYMEDVVAVIMDKQGKPHLKIETSKMVHFNENDTSELTEPQLTIYRKSPQPWFITSKSARATQGIDRIDFWEDVTIHHSADIASPATVIKTPSLAVFIKDQTAKTNEFITLVQPNIVIKALGMVADMNAGNIKLLSQARGEYAPST